MIEIHDTSYTHLLAPGEIDLKDLVGAADRLADNVTYLGSPVADIDAKLVGETMSFTVAFANGLHQITFKGPCAEVNILLGYATALKDARKDKWRLERLVRFITDRTRSLPADLPSYWECYVE